MYATFGQFCHIFRLEYEIKRCNWRILPQKFGDFSHIHANAGSAPHIVDRIGVVGIVLLGAFCHHIPHVGDIGQFCHIQFLERAGADLALQESA